MGHTLVVGNGINIQFGGSDYKNDAIILRALNNLDYKDYSKILNIAVTSQEIKECLLGFGQKILPAILKGYYDRQCTSPQELFSLQRVKSQYSLGCPIEFIGMEDFFFIPRIFNNSFLEDELFNKATRDGMSWIFLDAIFNNGELQRIHSSISSTALTKLREFFDSFDSIYTLNYDHNVEKISGREVFYLHGDFCTLHDQYNQKTVLGSACKRMGKKYTIKPQNKHMYCNAIMNFSGASKEDEMTIYNGSVIGVKDIRKRIISGLNQDDIATIEKLNDSSNESSYLAYNSIQALIENPNLYYHEYPNKSFKRITGNVSIVGLSPKNDEHVWRMLLSNTSQ